MASFRSLTVRRKVATVRRLTLDLTKAPDRGRGLAAPKETDPKGKEVDIVGIS